MTHTYDTRGRWVNSLKGTEGRREKKAVEKIKTNSKYFYYYAKKFSNINIVPCPKRMCKILSDQYTTVFSSPVCDTEEIGIQGRLGKWLRRFLTESY